MSGRCGLCGEGPGPRGFFGGNADGLSLHHDDDRQVVGRRTDGSEIRVTCYEAWTTYKRRPEASR
jgi:hypothetical protein